MGYAEVRAAEMNLEKVRAECKARLEQAEAQFRAELPFLGDDIFVLIAAELDITMLGRARRVQRGSSRQSHILVHASLGSCAGGQGGTPNLNRGPATRVNSPAQWPLQSRHRLAMVTVVRHIVCRAWLNHDPLPLAVDPHREPAPCEPLLVRKRAEKREARWRAVARCGVAIEFHPLRSRQP